MKVSVVIGRFQVPDLTPGHRYLIESARSRGEILIVLLGCSGGQPTKKNPLDFPSRKAMIEKSYPTAIVAPVYDHPSDKEWSARVDKLVGSLIPYGSFSPSLEVTLYGSRKSFIESYSGMFDCMVLTEELMSNSGTDIRDKVGSQVPSNSDQRAGAIYSVYNRYPGVYLCTDVAILTPREDAVLLGRKPGMDQWQFIGGFVDPIDKDIHAAAKREAWEETRLYVEDLKVIGTFKVDDTRYRGTEASMFSVFFKGKNGYGDLWEASDDIEELRWFPLETLQKYPATCVIPMHQPLLEALLKNINNEE